MKTLISQNGVEINSVTIPQVFFCQCGAIFHSDEYKVDTFTDDVLEETITVISDTCPTCFNHCDLNLGD